MIPQSIKYVRKSLPDIFEDVKNNYQLFLCEQLTVWGMLCNPSYQGKACFGKTELTERQKITRPLLHRCDYLSLCSANLERLPDELIEILVPGLISEQTFMLIKEQLEKKH